jgi:protoporphyrinogen oxidase
LAKYAGIKNIAVVCAIAKLNKPLTDNFWLNINDEEMDIPGLVEYSNLKPMKNTIVYVPFYMPYENPKYQDSDNVFIEKVKRYLMKINPDLTDGNFLQININRYRYSQPICGPEFLQNLPDKKTPIEGLWIADTSYYYPEDRGISESIGFGRAMAKQAVNRD